MPEHLVVTKLHLNARLADRPGITGKNAATAVNVCCGVSLARIFPRPLGHDSRVALDMSSCNDF